MVAHNQLILCPVLIGRTSELRSLQEDIDAAMSSQHVMTCISGEAGVGKTRLVKEAAAYALVRGCVVLCGNCFPHDEAHPYALVVDLLRRQFVGQPPEEQRIITDPIVRELAFLLPGIVPLAFEPSAPTDPLDPETHKRRLFAAFSHYLLRMAAHKPLVLVCEDLHWCDALRRIHAPHTSRPTAWDELREPRPGDLRLPLRQWAILRYASSAGRDLHRWRSERYAVACSGEGSRRDLQH